MKITLLCEYMERPVGLDMACPRFFWSIDDNSVAVKGYQIKVFENDKDCEKNDFVVRKKAELVWDSGVQEKTAFQDVYQGLELESGMTYCWQVTLITEKNEKKECVDSEMAYFTMGLLDKGEWKAKWIGGIKIDQSCYLYRKDFVLAEKIKRAAAFVASP